MINEILPPAWNTWLADHTFLGNDLTQWAALLGVVLAALVIGKIISFLLVRQANRLARTEGWNLAELLLRCLEKPIVVLVLAGGLYVAIGGGIMSLPEQSAIFWGRIIQALAVFAGGWMIYRLVDVVEHFLRHWTSKTETLLDDQLVPLIRKSLRVFLVIVIILFVAENVLQWDITALVTGLGIGGLAFALAAKDTIANIFGSITIFADRPFHMGDRIKVKGQDGSVEEVGFRSTRIRTLSGHLVTIPNAVIANETIENVARRPYIKRVLNVTITYDTPPAKVRRAVEILREMLEARKEHFPEENPGRVYFSDFNAESLNLVVYYWFAPPQWWDYLEFTHAFNMELLERYNDEGIEFAFPTRTLHLKHEMPPGALPAGPGLDAALRLNGDGQPARGHVRRTEQTDRGAIGADGP